jgi:purine-binding chemotaxis protein CheW
MNKTNFIEALKQATGLTRAKAAKVVDAMFDSMAEALAMGYSVEIRGFGRIYVKDYQPRICRNPKSGEPLQVPRRKLPLFRCSRKLNRRVDYKQLPKEKEQIEPPEQAARALTDIQGKYLSFSLGIEEYGISILKTKEIIGMMPVTTVPLAPKFVKGVINLRGRVIPVVDLRLRLGMDAADYTERTCIIVTEITANAESVPVGIIVDSVSEVLNIKAEDIETAPRLGIKLTTDYILGTVKVEGGVKILLDIDRVFSGKEVTRLKHVE